MHRVGLIVVLYGVCGEAFASFVNFEEHNSTAREAASRLPEPSGVVPDTLGGSLAVEGRTLKSSEKVGNAPQTSEDYGNAPQTSEDYGKGRKPSEDYGKGPPEVEVEVEGEVEGEVEREGEGKKNMSPGGDDFASPGEGVSAEKGAEAPSPSSQASRSAGSALAARNGRAHGSAAPATKARDAPSDVQRVVDAYNEHRGVQPEARAIAPARAKRIRALIR